MSSLASIRPQGMKQGDLCQMLYDIIYALITTGAAATTNWTISVRSKVDGTWTGSAVMDKRLEPNGWNQAHFVQALYETVYYLIASVAGATEADWTGQIGRRILQSTGIHTLTGGTTTRNYWLYFLGLSQGDLCQLLYETVECMIDDVAAYSSSNFTLDVADRTEGNMAGISG